MMKKITSRVFTIVIVVLFVGMCTVQSRYGGSVGMIYVDDDNVDGPWDGSLEHPFQYLQDGINVANDGDSVYVFSGVYYEHVVVDKTITLQGEDANCTVIDGGGSGDVVYVSADSVSICGFTIQNSGPDLLGGYDAGIDLRSDGNTITGNFIIDNTYGILTYVYLSSCNSISESEFAGNSYGIYLWFSSENIISRNILTDCGVGIRLDTSCSNNCIEKNMMVNTDGGVFLSCSSNYNIIINNQIVGPSSSGVYLEGTEGSCICNYIAGNYINNSIRGIELSDSYDNIIIENTVTNNSYIGVSLVDSHNNIIFRNIIYTNLYVAIFLGYSSVNTILKNIVKYNNYGLWAAYSSNNNMIYYNNFIDNEQNAYDECTNTWYNEALRQGNYWSDFDEPDEGAYDNNLDGIVDDPYNIPGGNNQDMYPLVNPLIPIIGDVDDDGDVDQSDLGILLAAWDTGPSDPNWNFWADLNCDAHISQSDLGILLSHYNRRRI